jgi:2-polyprenyl-6-methoxyphenol hydroxylase-like FAD-dependent oxidoreductase
MDFPVTIVGAGLGGLLLARALHVRGIPTTVYDADPSAESRTQGGQLDIHEPDGQAALAAAGLTQQFRAIVHQGGEATRVLQPDGSMLLDQPDDGTGARPEVLRGDLRRILLEALPDGTVQWGRKVRGAHPLGGGAHRLEFADGSAVDTRLLVGADGAWSKIRPLLSPATPAYTGAVFVETYLHDVDVRHPEPAAAVGRGAMYALTPGKGIVAHREEGAVVHTYVMLRRPPLGARARGDPARRRSAPDAALGRRCEPGDVRRCAVGRCDRRTPPRRGVGAGRLRRRDVHPQCVRGC